MSRQLTLDVTLRDDATFDNYIGAAGNELQQKFTGPFDWIHVWGYPGTGRSHLLQACCHRYEASIYLAGLRGHKVDVLDGLESMNLICIDDIDEILGRADWEEALFHLMNAVKDQGKRIILASERQASALPVRLSDLHSRIISAASIETADLTDEQKLQALMQRAHIRGFRLGEEVGRFILSRSSRDMRQLLDLLCRLGLETLRQGKTVTIPFVKQILSY
ncbi:MAG: DnaA regulatory inactivator Hda [bacterium]